MASRQANGRSSIHQDKGGSWHGYVTVGLRPDGRPDRRHVRGTTKAAVAKKVRELEKRRDEGTALDPGRAPTVESWAATWLQTVVRHRVKPKTLDNYESDLRVHIIPRLGAHRLDRLRPEHIQAMYAAMLHDGASPALVNHVRRTLNVLLNDAVKRDQLARNPVQRASAPRQEEHEIDPLTVGEARRVLAAAPAERNGAAWIVALSLGLRRGEALGLRWSDVDLPSRTIRIRQALQRLAWKHGCADPHRCSDAHHRSTPCPLRCVQHRDRARGCPPPCPPACTGHARHCPQRTGGGIVTTSPKSRAGRRLLVLPAPLVLALTEHRAAQDEERYLAGDAWHHNDLVFAQPNGKPIDPEAHSRAWKSLLKRAGVRQARLHDARHTAATLLLAQGVDSRTVMDLMGWSQASMAHRYQHVILELRQAAADRMTDALWG